MRRVLEERRDQLALHQVGMALALAHDGPPVAPDEDLGGAGAGVVVGGHREAVGAGAHDVEQVALPGIGQLAVAGEVVAALAHRADQVGVGDRAVLAYRAHLVVGVVEAGTQEVVHPRVGYYEVLLAALLAVYDAGQEGAGPTGDVAAHLAQDLRPRRLERRADGGDELFRAGSLLVLVADAQSTAHVEVSDIEAAVLELLYQLGALFDRLGEGGELGDLGSYVLVNPDEVNAPVLPHPLGERERLVNGDAELIESPSGGDVLVGPGVHVRVDPQRDARPLAVPAGQTV